MISGGENRYLLDTNVAIWLDRSTRRIPSQILDVLENPMSRLFLSAVSFWELAIKQNLGKIEDGIRLDRLLLTYGMQELAISSKYSEMVRSLPLLHNDPFDRMLIAQTLVEGMILVTADHRLADYPVPVLQV